jgi:hypothetical protein
MFLRADTRTQQEDPDVTCTVRIAARTGLNPIDEGGTIKMEFPLPVWMEWVVAGGSVVIGVVVLKFLDLIYK